MSTKSRESIYGTTIRMSAERAKEARKVADRLACEAWNYRMLGYIRAQSLLRNAAGPYIRVDRVTLAASWSLPVHTQLRTCRDAAVTDAKCQ